MDLITQDGNRVLLCTCQQDLRELIPMFIVYVANCLGCHAVHVPSFSASWPICACEQRHHLRVQRLQTEPRSEWADHADPQLLTFCINARTAFLCQVFQGDFDDHFWAAGRSQDSPKASSSQGQPANRGVDPLLANDPWKTPAKQLFSTRWEDLLLPADHPLQEADGTKLEQTHKL